MNVIPFIILFLPLLAAAVIALFTRRDRELSAKLSIGAVAISFVLSLGVLFFPAAFQSTALCWLSVGDLNIQLGVTIDGLSRLMLLIVTGVGLLIHIYSYGYMHEDRSVSRFFASLSLFTFSMLGIVLANNFVQMFIFWELVGVSSYLLIGFWYEREPAADAAKKAFITNRLGDFGFILGILLVWATLGSVNFDELKSALTQNPHALGALAGVAGLLLFCGAMGKSAQFPLHVWLPDAMEGPTPVSALIHAATMVAAGVYMLCRVFFLLDLPVTWPASLSFLAGWTALDVTAWIGGFTALLAALIAVQQNDIKRILAYSTLSQLGYMVMAVGLHVPAAAMFHLTTHAFFKALLFLGAGSVIHALHHEQDIWRMGGLKKKMPVTGWTFFVGTLALCGLPPLSGFYSKDAILAAAVDHEHGRYGLFILATVVAVLTTFYMFRLWFVAFRGDARSEAASHAPESPGVMIWPLRLLAVVSIFAGIVGFDQFIARAFPGEHGHSLPWYQAILEPFNHSPMAAFFGLLAAAVGFSLAYSLYAGTAQDPLPARLGALSRAMQNRFYFDELYAGLIAVTHEMVSYVAAWVDRWLISGLMVRGTHGTTELAGRALRLLQTGNLQTYALLLVAGVAVLLFLVLRQ
jgi:NADH-quinone oxidoreductase subunit L